MPYPLARISQDAGLPWPRPRDLEQIELPFAPRTEVIVDGRRGVQEATIEPGQSVAVATPAPESSVAPLIDFFAMLLVISRGLDRFSLAVAKRAQFYESSGRRGR